VCRTENPTGLPRPKGWNHMDQKDCKEHVTRLCTSILSIIIHCFPRFLYALYILGFVFFFCDLRKFEATHRVLCPGDLCLQCQGYGKSPDRGAAAGLSGWISSRSAQKGPGDATGVIRASRASRVSCVSRVSRVVRQCNVYRETRSHGPFGHRWFLSEQMKHVHT
jgi:hypothetical protein